MVPDRLVAEANMEAYRYVYCIEVGLRELIIETLSSAEGPRWFRHRVPGDILQEAKRAFEYEKSLKWTNLVPHHPLYYIEFASLRKIIERSDNWRDVFSAIFSRKDVLSATLCQIEPIRNKVAHNRKTTPEDVAFLRSACAVVANAVRRDRFEQLVSRCTSAATVSEKLGELRRELEGATQTCLRVEALNGLQVWGKVSGEWWFDELYLGSTPEGIKRAFGALAEYGRLPRGRGEGHKLERWVKERGVEAIAGEALADLRKMEDAWPS